MTEIFTRWDVADHLRTEKDARFYVEAAFEEDLGDGRLIGAALSDIIRGRNVSELAREIGMTREGLYKALSEAGMLQNLCSGIPFSGDEHWGGWIL